MFSGLYAGFAELPASASNGRRLLVMGILKDKVAIVTGGYSGIGRGISEALRSEGAEVVIADINIDNEKLLETRGKFTLIDVDVSKKQQIESLVETVMSKFSRIDILINNAGICEVCPIEDVSEEQWDRMLGVNLKGPFFACQAVTSIMKRQKYGKIINVSSIAARTGGLLVGSHYACSKAGVECLTRCLAKTLAPYGVNVNSVAPAITKTRMVDDFSCEQQENVVKGIPMGRLGSVSDIAETVLFLVSDVSSFITGQTIHVNGGSLML